MWKGEGRVYRIDGGVPAGTNIRPGELGCLMTRMRMINTTRPGKRRRKPSGIDMDEFPFNLMRLRKKDSRESALGFSSFQSAAWGAEETEGRRLYSRCTKPIMKNSYPERRRAFALF
jgi:hypothetical protein